MDQKKYFDKQAEKIFQLASDYEYCYAYGCGNSNEDKLKEGIIKILKDCFNQGKQALTNGGD